MDASLRGPLQNRSANVQRLTLAIAKLAPTSRQQGSAKVSAVSYAHLIPPRLGFTVTETVRPPQPVEPDPFIARPKPA